MTQVKLTNNKSADYEEYVNPDYVLIKCTNDKVLKISKKKIVGGKKAYDMILTGLDNYTTNDKAKLFIDKLVEKMKLG